MIWIDSHSRVDEGVTIGNCRTYPLLFANDLVLLATRRVARNFDKGRANYNQVSTLKYIITLVFKASSKIMPFSDTSFSE